MKHIKGQGPCQKAPDLTKLEGMRTERDGDHVLVAVVSRDVVRFGFEFNGEEHSAPLTRKQAHALADALHDAAHRSARAPARVQQPVTVPEHLADLRARVAMLEAALAERNER